MKRALYSACAALMIGAAAVIGYTFGLNAWTLIAGVLLLACPIAVTIIAWRETRRTAREIRTVVSEELRRRHS